LRSHFTKALGLTCIPAFERTEFADHDNIATEIKRIDLSTRRGLREDAR